MAKSYARYHDNIVQFQPKDNVKLQRMTQGMEQLEHESHLFIVVLGTLIGATIALFIGYHINPSVFHSLLLSIFPIIIAYLLRRVYIYTLIHS